MCTQTTVLRSGRCSRHRLHSSHVLRRPQVSFSVIARLLVREQLSRHASDTPFKELLLAPHSKRSSAPDPACEANTEDTVRYGLCAFFSHIPYSQVCAHEVHGWAHWRAGKRAGLGPTARGTGAAPLTHGQVARVAPKRARCFNSKGTSFHVVLELEHV